ncbi:UPF0488 protein CG14286 [Ceratina calcarata]|uniref:UPF0488 protein CG14286 n=1 Tax=Ceratina calcarata TaxID=156304 RepID=A0AAJ7JHW5_9HYME|nr:UPF0488 protein CG14286 [Ceratina calcarata]
MPPKSKPSGKKLGTKRNNAEPPKLTNSGNSNVETASGLSQEAEDQFELELCWCIQHLELCLANRRHSERQMQDLNKSIITLKSNTVPLIKKRQIMRNTLGDYREKMAQDEQKHGRTASSIKFISPSSKNKKGTFLKRAASMSVKESVNSNDENIETAFKFNFQVTE